MIERSSEQNPVEDAVAERQILGDALHERELAAAAAERVDPDELVAAGVGRQGLRAAPDVEHTALQLRELRERSGVLPVADRQVPGRVAVVDLRAVCLELLPQPPLGLHIAIGRRHRRVVPVRVAAVAGGAAGVREGSMADRTAEDLGKHRSTDAGGHRRQASERSARAGYDLRPR